jgi:excisionase family DNA binding protein
VKPEGTPVLVSKAAERVGVSERTVRRWITARMLTCYKTQKGVRVVILQDVIALEARLRQDVVLSSRAKLRREHVAAIAEMRREPVSQTA